MRLTTSQQEAIMATSRNLQVLACAGSGKTEVLAHRVAHVLTRQHNPLAPANVVAFTFTNKAAAELRRRIVDRVTEQSSKPVTGMADMFIGTIHSFCLDLLTTECPEFLKFESLDEVRQALYIWHDEERSGFARFQDLDGNPPDERYAFSNYLKSLSRIRESDIVNLPALQRTPAYRAVEHYRRQLLDDAYLDFDEQLLRTVEMLETDAGVRERIHGRIRYLLVDEYQDINPVQERLIRLIHDGGAELCVVGDDDQTIYQWRGSNVDNIISFAERYDDVRQVPLEENHRSSDGIITLAREFIGVVDNRLPKNMAYADAQECEPGDITAHEFDNAEDEAQHIARTIRSLHGVEFNDRGEKRGLTWSDMAVLVRIGRHPAGLIASALTEAGIPAIVQWQGSLLGSEEGQAVRDLFHYIADCMVEFGDSDFRASPGRNHLVATWASARFGLSAEVVEAAVAYADQIRELLLEGDSSVSTLQEIYREFLGRMRVDESRLPEETRGETMYSLGAISGAINAWESINYRLPPSEKFNEFAQFLSVDGYGLFNEALGSNPYATPDAVTICTIHRAKGCEWPAVFIPALTDGIFPGPQGYRDHTWTYVPRVAIADAGRYENNIENEDRLFYVAMTRSQKFLHFTWAPAFNNRGRPLNRPSRYWNQVVRSPLVSRSMPDYTGRTRMRAEPKGHVSDVELSFAHLKHLLECPYQFRLKVLCGFEAPLGGAMGFGKGLHDALAEVHHSVARGEVVDESKVPELVKRHLLLRCADEATGARMADLAAEILTNYLRDNAEILHQVQFAERNIAVHLDGGITVKGRVDLIRRDDDGRVSIVDLKSNHRSQAEEVTRDQLSTYALGYRELTGQDADLIETYELEERERRPEIISGQLLHEMEARTRMAVGALRQNQMQPTPAPAKCRRCDVNDLCPASMAHVGSG